MIDKTENYNLYLTWMIKLNKESFHHYNTKLRKIIETNTLVDGQTKEDKNK